ncbi:isovaleryl-CoA dehydrogenase [Niveibacterium umoris]|uniref:Putative acyl-CoA dehydrogenase n=1 Tax=Niveibacterium umoris TaxID=1193620 RepID=A0A840BQG0_9RHOO|nr:isovaleryl-CoA dehydrogenase [Niveibacterium umoris]MBB4013066.1 putative acyl-CoA dehydrogenase [Niveibacterium umoris]
MRWPTHDVTNQSPELGDYNLFDADPALQEAAAREGAGWAIKQLRETGTVLGRVESFEAGRLANAYAPLLHAFDSRGHRVDQVEFHPAWHTLMAGIVARGFHAAPWAEPRPGAHAARAAGYLMQAQVEAGSLCPTTMTYGAIPALSRDPALARDWLPTLCSRDYDPRDLPFALKRGGLIGMGMTEKQGGSDVRANTTRAEPDGHGAFVLNGHKWFFSCPQIDAHLVLAQAPGGLSCFFVPRWRPDGSKNPVLVQRLKDKLGNRSNASSEVEFHDAYGTLLGEAGRGVPTILEMGTYTRLDCVLGSTGLMRQALTRALHHARHRSAFGARLVDQPLMRNVLADLALEVEAAIALALRLARMFDDTDDASAHLRRLLTPAAKYWICKRGPELAAEAMEVMGGNGYVETGVHARIYREMPVNSIWEGSGNVMCLDVLRALGRSHAAADALAAELAPAGGRNPHFDAFAARLLARLRDLPTCGEAGARRLTQDIVLAVQGALLLLHAPEGISDAFCRARLAGDWGYSFGTLPANADFAVLLARALQD